MQADACDWWHSARQALVGAVRVVAAVSGGSDSVALLRFLDGLARDSYLIEITVAHLHHGTRGAESDADAAFVADLAARLGWPCVVGHWRPKRTNHFESDARRARLDWLKRVAAEQGAGAVLLGHTKDDQAETILHRILRGTGLRGLSGIPARRELAPGIDLVRPFLAATRAQLRAYLADLDQPFREDLTNLDTSRTRSRIRHDLLPKLAAEYNPEVADALVRLASHAAETLDARWQGWRGLRVERSADGFAVGLASIRTLSPPDRLAALQDRWRDLAWPERDMDAARWRRLSDWITEGGPGYDIGGGVSVSIREDDVVFKRAPEHASGPPEPVALPIPGRVRFGPLEIFTSESEGQETVDADSIVGGLVVRTMRDGDRFDPLGLQGKTQSLNDFLRGRGVPREQRRHVPLVCDDRGILWVVGHRIAHRSRRTDRTKKQLGFTCHM